MAPSSSPRRKRSRRPSLSPTTPPADGRDILNSLPSEMLDEILRHLPAIEDVVRTSGVSTSWRRRWANCPGLVFTFSGYHPPAAVDAVLAGYKPRIGEFNLEITDASYGKADGWIGALAAKGVTSLTVLMNQHSWPWQVDVLPSAVFSCSDLTSLVLKYCLMPPVPDGFQGFPNLAYLELREVETRFPRTLELMISMSPSLTTLCIIYPNIKTDNEDGSFDNWVIHAPNLKEFELRSHDAYGCSIVNLASLVEAHVVFDGPHLVTMLSGMTQVQKLSVDLLEDSIVQSQPSYFRNLTILEIWGIFSQSSNVVSTLHLLKSARNMKNLHITTIHEDNKIIEVDTEFSYAQWTGLFPRLKSVCFSGIQSQSNEIQFIKFLLLEASELEKVQISVHNRSLKSMEVMSSELSKYEKASSQAEVTFIPFHGYYLENEEEEPEIVGGH